MTSWFTQLWQHMWRFVFFSAADCTVALAIVRVLQESTVLFFFIIVVVLPFLLSIIFRLTHHVSINTSSYMWCLSNRLHRGRSGRSFNRSSSRNRNTSRVPLCYRTTPSDQWGGFSGHQPMNVALPNRQRPTQTKAKGKGDMQGRPAAPGSKPKNFTRGETSESQRLRALCALPAPKEQRDWEKPYRYHIIKKDQKNLWERWKWQRIWELLSSQLEKVNRK